MGRPRHRCGSGGFWTQDLGCLLRVTDAHFTVSSGSILLLNSTLSTFGALFSFKGVFISSFLSVFLQGLCICQLIVCTIALDENSSFSRHTPIFRFFRFLRRGCQSCRVPHSRGPPGLGAL